MTPRTSPWLCLILAAGFLVGSAGAEPFALSLSGRLVRADGMPAVGPVALEIRAYRQATGGPQVAGATLTLAGVEVADGAFQVPLAWSDGVRAALFDGAQDVWLEVVDVTNGRTYPRQRLGAVPHALRTPVDETTLSYGADGRLGVVAANASTLQGQEVDATPPAAVGQVLKWDGSKWKADDDAVGAPGGGVQSLNGLTGATQTLAVGSAGTAPAWTSAGAVHQLDIPLASAGAGVTAGLLSNAQYATLNAKVAPSRQIATGAGLAGGGDLSADRTLSLSVTGLPAETTGADDDLLIVHDTSAGAVRRMSRADLLRGAVTNDAVAAGAAIAASKIAGLGALATASSVGAGQLEAGAVSGGTGGVIADGTITGADLAAGAVSGGTGGVIADGTITADDLAAGAVTDAKLASGIDAAKITTGTLPSAQLPAGLARSDGAQPAGAVTLGTTSAHPLLLETNDVTAVTIGSDGTVGVGTATPNARFGVASTGADGTSVVRIDGYAGNSGANNVTLDVRGNLDNHTGSALLRLTHTNPAGGSPNDQSFLVRAFGDVHGDGDNTSSDDVFHVTTTGRAHLSGPVGVGTTAPSARIHVQTKGDNNVGIVVRADNATQSANLQEWTRSDGAVLAAVTSTGGYTGFAYGRKGTDLPSAATLVLGADGDYFNVTGTTNVTALTSRPAGTRVTLRFDGALTLVHNAATSPRLILAGGGDFVTAAGATFELLSLGGGDWQELTRYVTNDSHVYATRTTAASIPNGAHTTLVFNSEVADTQGEYNPATGIFTAKQDGSYLVQGQAVLHGAFSAGGYCHVMLFLNGSNVALGTLFQATSAATVYCLSQLNTTINLVKGDQLLVDVYQSSGASQSLTIGAGYNYFSIKRLR